jgi:hypothetical protein
MPARTIKRNLTKGHVEIIGNLRTEGHGLMTNDPSQNTISSNAVRVPISIGTSITNTNKNNDINKFFLKIHPKSYISFD